MPKTDLLDINGKKVRTINLPPEAFAAKVNPQLMAQAVRVYLANQRQAYPKTKTRAEINRTKAKWYRQKGTGRARHGSRAAPIFVGGGVAHGPTGEQNYKLKMPQKMKRAALFSSLTFKFKKGDILLVEGLEKIAPKTKEMREALEKLKANHPSGQKSQSPKRAKKLKIMLVLPQVFENVARAARNIKNVSLTPVNSLNTYEVLENEKIIFMVESIKKLKETFLKE